MKNIIYGVDVDSNFTTKDVRDAILMCFKEAHNEILQQTYDSGVLTSEEIENLKKADIEILVKKSFEKVGGDYSNPTRESLIGVIKELKQFAINFRAEEIANKNFAQIMILINKLP